MAEPVIDCRLAAAPFDAAALLAELQQRAGDDGANPGAVASFAGIARGRDAQGERLTALDLQAHDRLTLPSMQAIARDTSERFEPSHLLVIHRHGRILPGEAIVLVAAVASHRRAALLAVDYAMDRLKTEAVFWKREVGPGGSRWIEPTQADRAAAANWDNDRGTG